MIILTVKQVMMLLMAAMAKTHCGETKAVMKFVEAKAMMKFGEAKAMMKFGEAKTMIILMVE